MYSEKSTATVESSRGSLPMHNGPEGAGVHGGLCHEPVWSEYSAEVQNLDHAGFARRPEPDSG